MFSSDSFCESSLAPATVPDGRAAGSGMSPPLHTNSGPAAEDTESAVVPNTTITNDIIRDLIDREAPRMCRLATAPTNHCQSAPQVKGEQLSSHRSGPEALPPIRLIHPKFGGQASFRTFREAALCILLMDGAPLLEFVRWASEMKTQIKRDPACVPRNEFWRYFLLHDPSIPENVLVTPRGGGGMTSDVVGESENEPPRKLKVSNHNRSQTLSQPPDRSLDEDRERPVNGTKSHLETAASDTDTEGDAIGRGRKRRQLRRPKSHTLQQ